jgi:hypothetical protein
MESPQIFGVMLKHVLAASMTSSNVRKSPPGSKDFCFALWQHDYLAEKLSILRLRATSSDQFVGLMAAASKHAASFHLKAIAAWDVSPDLLKGTSWTNEAREEHLPMLALYDQNPWKWEQVEEYAWC